jgi:hypothetical protein
VYRVRLCLLAFQDNGVDSDEGASLISHKVASGCCQVGQATGKTP